MERSGESQSCNFECELEKHHTAGFGWALSCCGWDREEAADVLQTAYLKVLAGKARFGGRSDFRTWLFGVIRRTAAERRRRTRLARMSLLRLAGAADGGPPDAHGRLVLADAIRATVAALRRLPPRQREVLHLVFYEDMSIAQAAAVLGISVGSARTHYERGKRRMRRLLGEHAG